MKGRNSTLICLLIYFLLKSYCSVSQVKTSYVIVIGIDGLSAWGVKKHMPATLDSLMRQGVYSLSAKAVMPTLSAPNWASILTGDEPNVHHIKSNDWKSKEGQTLNEATIFRKVREYDSSISQSVFYQWKEFEELIEKENYINKYFGKDESATIEKVIQSFHADEFKFAFIHLDNVDSSGHKFGQRSKEYARAIHRADSLIGRLMYEVNQSQMKDNVYILVTSDHGFWGRHHGGISRRERNIPWILTGPGLKNNYNIPSNINTVDTSSVLYFLLTGIYSTTRNSRFMKDLYQKQ